MNFQAGRARQILLGLGVIVVVAAVVVFNVTKSTPKASGGSGHAEYSLLSFFPQKNYDTWLRDQISTFEKSHPGVSFHVQYTDPTHIIQKIKTGVASGQAPDIATQLPGAAQLQLWSAGRLLNLAPAIKSDPQWSSWLTGWSKVPPAQYKSGNAVFADNVSLGPMFIWYWKDMLAKAGIRSFPQTTAGLIAATKALKAKGLPTMALGLNSQALFNFDYTFYTLEANFDRNGVKARQADEGKYPWTSPEFAKAATLFKQLYDAGVFYDGAIEKNYDPQSKTDFGGAKASSAWPFGSWMDGAYPDSTVHNVGVALFPRTSTSLPLTLTAVNDLEFIVPTVTSQQKDPAHQRTILAFLKQLNGPDSQRELWAQGIFPVMTSVSDSNPSKSTWAPVLKAMINLADKTTAAVDENTYSPQTDAALTNGLQAVMVGSKSVSTLLNEVQAANKQDHPCAPHC
jgi:ABC-type glycerol-3-phosphate transport system substrate-binding protein